MEKEEAPETERCCMTKNGLPPRFKIQKTAPMAVAAQKISKIGNYRGSPRDRGYDSKWDRLSVAYRKRHPYCAYCQQEGRDTLTDLVDHIIPVVDRPDLKHEWSNLISSCVSCHGKKHSLEVFARNNGLIDMLPTWCRDRESRPPQFR